MAGFGLGGLRIRGKIMFIVGVAIILSAVVVGGFSIWQTTNKAEADLKAFEDEQINQQKEVLRDLVNSAATVLEKTYENSATKEAIQRIYGDSLKSLVDVPYTLIEKYYASLSAGTLVSEEEIKKQVLEDIKALRYGQAGYFWINDTHPNMVMHPIVTKLDGQDLTQFKKDGKVVMAEGTQTPMFVEFVKVCQASPTKDGYVAYFWPHPTDKERWVRKLSYVRLFEPWNWVIGTGVYVDQVEIEAQERAKATIASMRYGDKGYFWINDTHPNMVMHPILPVLDGKDLTEFKKDGQVVMAEGTKTPMFVEFVKVCQASPTKDGFVWYPWPDPQDKNKWVRKLSYVRLFEPWNWVIGTGVYINQIEAAVAAKRAELDRTVRTQVTFILIATVGIMILSFVFAFFLSRKYIEAPIRNSVSFAEAVKAGDLSDRLEVAESRDEVSILAKALDDMADSLEEKVRLAATIADGDLSSEVTLASDKDKLGRSLQTMILELNKLVKELYEASSQVDSGSSQISDSSQSLAQGATEQAASVQEMTAAVSQVSSQTRTNAENAKEANELAGAARESAQSGNQEIQDMVEAMDKINEASTEIAKIIKVIDDIAFQTNLLALNAAVEAARAGKHGKGFAVVAQEVRALAGRSAKAARETAELIQSTGQRVTRGMDLANTTAASLGKIVESVSQVAELISEISKSTQEQAQAITLIDQGLNQIDSVTQRNTASAEETAAAAQELSAQSSYVRSLLARFKLKDQENDHQGVSVLTGPHGHVLEDAEEDIPVRQVIGPPDAW